MLACLSAYEPLPIDRVNSYRNMVIGGTTYIWRMDNSSVCVSFNPPFSR
jgi:hypothetical protein